KTMESKINLGLYFVGETLNVHGPIGGFNITISLSTGFSAARNICE
ncbi:MAG: NAD(P)/FAD-dependent oxidoreductase, partial [Candidatus Izimaplasma sp.]|nr:NAD(P)/FAD-dependent oxidoreductase [Candidatus Izimaplasma bacterium]